MLIQLCVKQGFYSTWKRLQSQVYGHINTIMHWNCSHCTNVLMTGHSLGAAVSGFGALEVTMDYNNVSSVVMNNFGMPRTGNPEYAAGFASLVPNSQRMVHYHDIVPHVPMIDLGFAILLFCVRDISPV